MTTKDKILRVKTGLRAGCGEDTSAPPPPANNGGGTPASGSTTNTKSFTLMSRVRNFLFAF